VLDGDELPRGVRRATVLRGRPEVVLPTGHPLAGAPEIGPAELRREPFVLMPGGDPMRRFAHRLFGAQLPDRSRTAGGAEVAALLVADGLGLAVLPDFVVAGHPLERAGLLVRRPVAGDGTTVRLVLLRRGAGPLPAPVRLLAQHLVDDEPRR
jgi:DNA-binding transcriptional LysR family regulator